jgi:anti-sigma B factor antagonist
MAEPFQVLSEKRQEATVLTPRGDIDMSCSPHFREALRAAQESRPKRLVVDMAGVGYMDSSGLATLVEAMKMTRSGGTRLVLSGLSDRVKAIFEIARLERYFTITPSVEAAISA